MRCDEISSDFQRIYFYVAALNAQSRNCEYGTQL